MKDVYFDISDLYYRVKKKFDSKLNYRKLLDLVGDVDKADAYGCQQKDEAFGFISHLSGLGIKVHYSTPKIFRVGDREVKSCNWNVDIAIAAMCSQQKHVVFCSSNVDLIPLYRHLQLLGIKVTVLSCGIPGPIKAVCDEWFEVPEDCVT